MKAIIPLVTAVAILGCFTPIQAAGSEHYTRNVAIVVWNGAEVLDWTGPSEVFKSAAGIGSVGDADAFNVYTVSKTTDPIVSQGFIQVVPQYSIENAPRPDIIVLPGGGGGSVRNDPEFLAWVGHAAKEAEVALSVCTGAFILGDLGLLDGKDATTWYGALDRFEGEFTNTHLRRGCRFVDNGQVITTAGVSAGIDGSLHLVARLLGRYIADQTAQYMEYKWSPEPYLARHYSLLNPSTDDHGRRLEQAGIYRSSGDHEAAIAIYRSMLENNPDDIVAENQLAATYFAAQRWQEAGAAYVESAKTPSLRPRALYNAACAYARAGDRDRAFDCLEGASDAGFHNAAWIQHDDDLKTLRDDPRFEHLLEHMRPATKAAAGN